MYKYRYIYCTLPGSYMAGFRLFSIHFEDNIKVHITHLINNRHRSMALDQQQQLWSSHG